MQLIHPVILCGGGGTRLWPASRTACPKPFLELVGERTLFQQALDRVAGAGRFSAPLIVAGAQHREFIAQQAGGDYRLLVEPEARNTAAAIAAAAHRLAPDDIMLVCPSDHHIADTDAFRRCAEAAAELAREDWLVSFGIAADRPETGFGYLQRGAALGAGYRIERFVEKPDRATAEGYLANGNYSWNGGIFAFRAGFFLEELAKYRPQLAALVAQAVAEGHEDGSAFHPRPGPFADIAGESVDYAVMENTARAAMVPADMGWSDIGNWAALADAIGESDGQSDAKGNVARGRADFDDCQGVLAFSDGPRISAIGLEDICIVVDGDEVLVTTRSGAQRVGKLPGALGQKPAQ